MLAVNGQDVSNYWEWTNECWANHTTLWKAVIIIKYISIRQRTLINAAMWNQWLKHHRCVSELSMLESFKYIINKEWCISVPPVHELHTGPVHVQRNQDHLSAELFNRCWHKLAQGTMGVFEVTGSQSPSQTTFCD